MLILRSNRLLIHRILCIHLWFNNNVFLNGWLLSSWSDFYSIVYSTFEIISLTLTSSKGWKENVLIEESERLKRLQRKRNKMQKGSNNRYRLGKLIRKEYYKLTCKKNDAANQLCAKIKKHSGIIVIQDEQISSWKHKHGKKIQNGILGRVK